MNIISKMDRDIVEWKKVEEELLNEKKFTEAALNAQRDTFFSNPLVNKGKTSHKSPTIP